MLIDAIKAIIYLLIFCTKTPYVAYQAAGPIKSLVSSETQSFSLYINVNSILHQLLRPLNVNLLAGCLSDAVFTGALLCVLTIGVCAIELQYRRQTKQKEILIFGIIVWRPAVPIRAIVED